MRPDMFEVLIERPRGGMRLNKPKGYRRAMRRMPLDEAPRWESTGRRWRVPTKWQTDLIGPLRRFLRSRLGHPWNNVYSEIRKRIDGRSLIQEHLLQHVYWEVERYVVLEGGRAYTVGGFPIRAGRLYVCPATGLLREVKRRRRRRGC